MNYPLHVKPHLSNIERRFYKSINGKKNQSLRPNATDTYITSEMKKSVRMIKEKIFKRKYSRHRNEKKKRGIT